MTIPGGGIDERRFFSSAVINTKRNLLKTREKLMFGMNFIYSTGQPITEPGSAYLIASGPYAPQKNVAYAPCAIPFVIRSVRDP